jgi:hypothetical protein
MTDDKWACENPPAIGRAKTSARGERRSFCAWFAPSLSRVWEQSFSSPDYGSGTLGEARLKPIRRLPYQAFALPINSLLAIGYFLWPAQATFYAGGDLDQLSQGIDLHLFHHAASVNLDGLFGDTQGGTDLFV